MLDFIRSPLGLSEWDKLIILVPLIIVAKILGWVFIKYGNYRDKNS